MTHQQVVKYWANLADISVKRGRIIHNYIENRIRYQGVLLSCVSASITKLEKKNIDTFLRRKRLTGKSRKKCHVELLLSDPSLNIAGQSDLVIEYARYIEILDWKTNEKTFEELNKHYNKFLGELKYLPQSKFNGYVIQLCLYALLAEKRFGKPCKKLSIVHIKGDVTEYVIDNALMLRVKESLRLILGFPAIKY